MLFNFHNSMYNEGDESVSSIFCLYQVVFLHLPPFQYGLGFTELFLTWQMRLIPTFSSSVSLLFLFGDKWYFIPTIMVLTLLSPKHFITYIFLVPLYHLNYHIFAFHVLYFLLNNTSPYPPSKLYNYLHFSPWNLFSTFNHSIIFYSFCACISYYCFFLTSKINNSV